jgi:hypothetical protein
MLGFVLWYHLDLFFTELDLFYTEHSPVKASFSIDKSYSLKDDMYRFTAALGKSAYQFPLVPRR